MRERWLEEADALAEVAAEAAYDTTHVDACLFASACDSPIEKLLAVHMATWGPLKLTMHGVWCHSTARDAESLMKIPFSDGLHITAQQPVGKYRVDFFILVCAPTAEGEKLLGIVVECDGHDFHERTKEQAARDRSRDRDLTAAGFTVVRFTGSELHRDAKACADQLLEIIRAIEPPETLFKARQSNWRTFQQVAH